MGRLRYNNALGTLGGALLAGQTTSTIDFGATAPAFDTLVAPDYIPLVIEPPAGSRSTNFEVVYLTAYAAGATTGTVTRAREGTASVGHSAGVTWVGAATTLDFSRLRYSPTTQFTGLSAGVEAGARTINAPSKGSEVYAVTVDQPCRFRVYASAALAAADLSRSQTVDPTGNHGCLLEVVMIAAGSLVLSPTVGLVEQDAVPSAVFPCNVRCDNGPTLNVTLNGYIQEA